MEAPWENESQANRQSMKRNRRCYLPSKVTTEQIEAAIEELGFGCELLEGDAKSES